MSLHLCQNWLTQTFYTNKIFLHSILHSMKFSGFILPVRFDSWILFKMFNQCNHYDNKYDAIHLNKNMKTLQAIVLSPPYITQQMSKLSNEKYKT